VPGRRHHGDPEQVCILGSCQDRCECAGCPAAEQCQPDGRCLPDACLGVDCPAGFYCVADGSCADACEGAVCPTGETCTAGECVPTSSSGGGGAGGSSGTGAGFNFGGEGGATTSGEGGASLGAGSAGDESSCGCRLPAAAGSERGWLLALLAAALLSCRRRPRRRS